ncbi:DNA-binding protein Fis [Paraglaciecola sp. T6c]|uniref:sigma-54-dependent Fis family transcriptional regulator n=1 Tax=Pseudoalteromonas atlantica (strain T6c / ATCC BAA-1087) TaxID=3042615 RepID=UPI00005C5D67|nr:sigma-54-dependent Fis family transcriptional regulator [Paraglaciecola sp. T6c]ABG42398.1 DNA-binding protein Fis [Paraglaciecola sp. T6c]
MDTTDKSALGNSEDEAILQPFNLINEKDKVLPEFQDLSDRLRFIPEEGRVVLGDNRLLIANLAFFSVMRQEHLNSFGVEKSRGILTRMGYSAGYQDAEEVATHFRSQGNAYEVLTAGPTLHALMGWALVEPIELEIDVANGHYYAEFMWKGSAEVALHLKNNDISLDPVCWMQIGYASGYASRFMGKRILYKEVMCSGMGDSKCKIIGRPVEKWDVPTPDIYYMYPEDLKSTVDLRPTHHIPLADTPKADNVTSYAGLIGASPAFINTLNLLKRVTKTNATVLFLGETGVGKERFARALHATSKRADGPFIAVNCAAIPVELIEAELFGVVKGAFSGATNSRLGRFERADGGTIFLDEVGTLDLASQAKLLRVLQEREFERVGDEHVRKVDIRVIAATNADLKIDVSEGRFRDDLWYRLNVFPIEIPPLRDRREDVPLLLEYFLNTFNTLHERSVKGYTERALDALIYYQYPGNIRELENMVERAIILAENDSALDIPMLFTAEKRSNISLPLSMTKHGHLRASKLEEQNDGQIEQLYESVLSQGKTMSEVESAIVLMAVEQAEGNLAEAARKLGMTRRQIEYKYSKLKL